VSIPGRDFDVVKEWTYLLFEEFFHQGDMERQQGLTVSMLCDRTTTHVAKSQPGFISFVSLPLFTNLAAIMPEMNKEVQQMKNNSEQWKLYEETELDKRVYERKDVKVVPISISSTEEQKNSKESLPAEIKK